jgi:hypothetical protein
MRQPRLAEMNLGVDDARQDMKAGGIDDLPRHAFADIAERSDAASPYADIGETLAGMIDEGPAFEDKVEGFGQG